MSSNSFIPEVLRVYSSEENLPNFISRLEITCQINIAAEYRADDIFNISPYHIPVFLKPISKEFLNQYCQDRHIAMDLSKKIINNYRGADIFSVDLKGRIISKKIKQISDEDFIVFFPVLIPFSFVEDIYYENDDRMNNALMGGYLKEDIHFFKSFEKKIQSKNIFSESTESITLDNGQLKELPNLGTNAQEIHKNFDVIRAIIYSLLDLKETPDLLSNFLYDLFFEDQFELKDILSSLLAENENLLSFKEATKVMKTVVSFIFSKGKIDKDIINEIFTTLVGQNVTPKAFKNLNESSIRFIEKLDFLNDLLLSNVSSDEFYTGKAHSNILQSLGMLHLFSNFDVYTKSREKKGKLPHIVKQYGKSPLHIYLVLLGLSNGCSNLIIDEDVYNDSNYIFDYIVLSFLNKKFDNFYSMDDVDIDRITLTNRILANSKFKYLCDELSIYQTKNLTLIQKLEKQIESLKHDKKSITDEIESLKNKIEVFQSQIKYTQSNPVDEKLKDEYAKDLKQDCQTETNDQDSKYPELIDVKK
jgi:hypothetical protein